MTNVARGWSGDLSNVPTRQGVFEALLCERTHLQMILTHEAVSNL
jgi:hypothetical protein